MTIQEFATKFRMQCRKDPCGDFSIEGKRGNIHENGKALSMLVLCSSAASMRNAHEKLAAFAVRTQNGDAEAVYNFKPGAIVEDDAVVISKVCRIRRKKILSPETLQKLMSNVGKMRAKLGKNSHCTVQ